MLHTTFLWRINRELKKKKKESGLSPSTGRDSSWLRCQDTHAALCLTGTYLISWQRAESNKCFVWTLSPWCSWQDLPPASDPSQTQTRKCSQAQLLWLLWSISLKSGTCAKLEVLAQVWGHTGEAWSYWRLRLHVSEPAGTLVFAQEMTFPFRRGSSPQPYLRHTNQMHHSY